MRQRLDTNTSVFVHVLAFCVWILCTVLGTYAYRFQQIKFFFKIESYGTIYIFKNYITTVFLFFSF